MLEDEAKAKAAKCTDRTNGISQSGNDKEEDCLIHNYDMKN